MDIEAFTDIFTLIQNCRVHLLSKHLKNYSLQLNNLNGKKNYRVGDVYSVNQTVNQL